MIITISEPFTSDDVMKLQEQFGTYIKTVIDIRNKVCSAGPDRHFESEKVLLDQGSKQSDIWGGGIDISSKAIDYNSFINIRPNDNNHSNEIQSEKIRDIYKELTEYFFSEIYVK